MSLVKTVLLSIALTLVASEITQAQATTFNPETQQVFTAVEKIGDNKRAFFPFTASSRNYTIRSDGWTESGSPPTLLRRFFQLRVGRPRRIDRVYFLEHENDLLLIYELTDEEYGWGYMVRLDQVRRAPKWITPVEGINLDLRRLRVGTLISGLRVCWARSICGLESTCGGKLI